VQQLNIRFVFEPSTIRDDVQDYDRIFGYIRFKN